jgi:UrcA family protein
LKENAMNAVKSDRRSSLWPVALALACLSGTAQVLASAPVETRSVSVRYADLDLDSAAGAAALYHRLQGAARVVCGFDEHRLANHAYLSRCNSGAISDAVASVNAPLLSAIHSAHRAGTVTAMLNE